MKNFIEIPGIETVKIRCLNISITHRILWLLIDCGYTTDWCPVHSDLIYIIGNKYFGNTYDYKEKKYMNEMPKEVIERKLITSEDFIKQYE